MRTSVLPVALAAVIAGSGVAVVACLTAPPPDLPGQSPRPAILHQAVQPPSGLLTQLPSQFVVPVQVADPNHCQWSLFVDSNPALTCEPCGAEVDAGVVLLLVELPELSPTQCYPNIQLTVARAFSPNSACTAPDSTGGDVVSWQYLPPGCLTYDAGALQDGAFPEAESGLPVVPESGSE